MDKEELANKNNEQSEQEKDFMDFVQHLKKFECRNKTSFEKGGVTSKVPESVILRNETVTISEKLNAIKEAAKAVQLAHFVQNLANEIGRAHV